MSQTFLSKADLHRLGRGIPANRPPLLRAYEISLRVIVRFLGRDWLNRHFAVDDGNLQKLPEAENDPAQARHIAQVIELAELLLNLQFQDGVARCLTGLQAPEIAIGRAGLEVGRFLFACQMAFRYADDPCLLEMRLADGTRVAANAHGKIAEGAAASADLVHDLLAATAAQPGAAAGPYFIFLQFPPSWSADRLGLLDEGTARFLAGADRRIASVKAYATAYAPARDLTFAVKEYDHLASDFARPAGWTVFAQPRTIRWRYLRGV